MLFLYCFRYNEDLELEDAVHTAILALKVSLRQSVCVWGGGDMDTKHRR